MGDIGSTISDHPWIVWVAIALVLALLELLSLDLVLLMAAIGALAAAVVSAFGAPIWLAVVALLVVSVALLGLLRPPLLEKLHNGPDLVSGHQALVGRVAHVVAPVDARGGRVELGGELWSARSLEVTAQYAEGEDVAVAAIDGATAVVTTLATETLLDTPTEG